MQTSPRLQRIVTQIALKHDVDWDTPGAYLRLALPGNGQLVVENIGAHRVSVTNYIEVHTDFIADPRVVLYTQWRVEGPRAGQTTCVWAPLEITELFGGWRLCAEVDPHATLILYDPLEQAQLAEFCDHILARNLQRFGWLELAQRAITAPAAKRAAVFPAQRPDDKPEGAL